MEKQSQSHDRGEQTTIVPAEYENKGKAVHEPASHRYKQSFRILSKHELQSRIFHFTLEAPMIARKIQAGQFIIIRPHKLSERIPLSVCGWDRDQGTINIVVMAIGKTSMEINEMNAGECFSDVVGPLGQPSRIEQFNGTCVVIGGGYGTGAVIPSAMALKEAGNRVVGIVGARSEGLLILKKELEFVCDDILVSTNDGSLGIKGMVTDALAELIQQEKVAHLLAVGPVPMMRAISELTRPFNISTHVSLNAIMVDGTGMCGACRVKIGGSTRFACFHGPDFDGHKVDFEELMKRQKMFVKEEKEAMLQAPYQEVVKK